MAAVGRIHFVVEFLERKYGAFAISRLIMMSGVPVRSFTATTPDDREALQKVRAAVMNLLSRDEFEELLRAAALEGREPWDT